ncbi:hypothetical protein CR513_07227, partial [Mucuna pruriens]
MTETDIESEPNVDSRVQQQAKTAPLPFPSWSLSTRKPETDEDLLKMFWRIEVNILLLDAIKQVPKYAKFLKELCIHKRNKLKAGAEVGGVLSTFIQMEVTTRTQPALPRKCRDPRIFSVSCTIGGGTFVDAMLDLGVSINVMLALVLKSLNLGYLEPTSVIIQLANRSVVQSMGILKDVLVQVNELIFLVDFYVLDMDDKTSGKGSTLILGRSFLMTVRTKIDVYVGTLSMEFRDNLVSFNIFEAMKHPPKDHSLYNIDIIEELVEEFTQLDSGNYNMPTFVEIFYASSIIEEADFINRTKVLDPSDSGNHVNSPDNLMNIFDSFDLLDQPRSITDLLPPQSPPNNELKPLPNHLKYIYLDNNQHSPQHKKAIEWKLFDLPGINPSIFMHRILMEEEASPIRQQQRRLNPTILEVVKKKIIKLLAVGIIYPILDTN